MIFENNFSDYYNAYKLCFDCNFTIMIEAPEKAKIRIRAEFEEEIR